MKVDPVDIIKVGGSILSNKKRYRTLKKRTIKKICKLLSEYRNPFILVHGAGSFGHIIADKFSINSGYSHPGQLEALARIRYDMTELSLYITKQLLKKGVQVINFQTSALAYITNEKRLSLYVDPLLKALELKIVPMLSGDIIFHHIQGFSILSGDRIIKELSKRLTVKRIIFITDVDGIEITNKETKRPTIVQETTQEELESLELYNKRVDDTIIDVTGMMKGKLAEIKEALNSGVEEVIIVNGKFPERIKKVLNNEETLCTRITR